MIKFSESPIDESQPLVVVVDHDIVWLHISVHDTLRVAVVKGLQHLVDVESDVVVSEALVQSSEVNISGVYILHDQSWGLGHWVSHHVDQIDDIHSASKCLQYFDLPSNLGLLNWLQNLNDDSLVVQGVDALIHFGVLSSSNLLDDLVIFLRTIIQKLLYPDI